MNLCLCEKKKYKVVMVSRTEEEESGYLDLLCCNTKTETKTSKIKKKSPDIKKELDCIGLDMSAPDYFKNQGGSINVTAEGERDNRIFHNWNNCPHEHIKKEIEKNEHRDTD